MKKKKRITHHIQYKIGSITALCSCKVHLGDIVKIRDNWYVFSNKSAQENKYFNIKEPLQDLPNQKHTKWMVVGIATFSRYGSLGQGDLFFLLRNAQGQECVSLADGFSRVSNIDVLDMFPKWQEKRDNFIIPRVNDSYFY